MPFEVLPSHPSVEQLEEGDGSYQQHIEGGDLNAFHLQAGSGSECFPDALSKIQKKPGHAATYQEEGSKDGGEQGVSFRSLFTQMHGFLHLQHGAVGEVGWQAEVRLLPGCFSQSFVFLFLVHTSSIFIKAYIFLRTRYSFTLALFSVSPKMRATSFNVFSS